MLLTIDAILALYDQRGEVRYGGEPVTQREHALQCAWRAEQDGMPPALIVACLLHDLGHLIHEPGVYPEHDVDDAHELRGERLLTALFPPAVLMPIRLHVTARRFRCAIDPACLAALSPSARRSLDLQGGPLTTGQVAAFQSMPWAQDAILLQRYDDEARLAAAPGHGFGRYRPLLQRLAFPGARRLVAAC